LSLQEDCEVPRHYVPGYYNKQLLNLTARTCWRSPRPGIKRGPREDVVKSVPGAKLNLSLDCAETLEVCRKVGRAVYITSQFFERTIKLAYPVKARVSFYSFCKYGHDCESKTLANVRAKQLIYTGFRDVLYPQSLIRQFGPNDRGANLRDFHPLDFEIDMNGDLQYHYPTDPQPAIAKLGATDILARAIAHGLGIISELGLQLKLENTFFITSGAKRYLYFNNNKKVAVTKFVDSNFDEKVMIKADRLSAYTDGANHFVPTGNYLLDEFTALAFKSDARRYFNHLRLNANITGEALFAARNDETFRLNIPFDDPIIGADNYNQVARVFLNHNGRPASSTRAILFNEFGSHPPNYLKQPFDHMSLSMLHTLGYVVI
ncbi:hypothetical protein L0F63_005434, partial [Massospora cicadina]